MTMESTLDAYVDAWNVTDDDAREALLAQAVTDDCVVQGPTGTFTGRPALLGLISSLRDRLVGASVVRKGPAAGGPRARFAWEILSADGAVLFAGEDEFELADDGRLCRIQVEL